MALEPTPSNPGGAAAADSGTGNVTGDPNNPGSDGNFDAGGAPDANQNNSGQDDDFAEFWKEPEDSSGAEGSPQRSASQDDSSGAPAVQQATPMEAVQTILDAVTFDDVLTPEVMTEMTDGNLEGFNKAVAASGRNAVKQSLMLSARMMNEISERLTTKMETRFNELLSADKANTDLNDALPFAKDPAIQPIARGIFAQAMNKTNGDKAKALEMTKRFFTNITNVTADDLDLGVAPRGESDVFDQQRSPNEPEDWLAELMVR